MGCCVSSALVHKSVHAGSQQQAAATRHQYIDPSFLVQILRTKQVRLLRAEYILEWIDSGRGPLPCRQDFPEEGFVDVDALNEQQLASLVIIAVSYCWITKDHPDPNCYHLQTLGSLVRCFLKSSFSSAPHKVTVNAIGDWRIKAALQQSGANFGAGDGHCVGIFLDWTGLYQDKPEGRRTSEENEVFKQALKTINIWYAHVTTIVWMLTSLPAGVQRKGYQDSGWTAFEASVASILTKGTDMLDITDVARNTLLTSDSCRLDYIQLSHDLMSRQSRVPALPDEFDSMIDGKVFTNGADKETVVKPKYAKTFHDLIPSSPTIQYSGLGLTPDNVYKILDLATMHIKKLETLDLSCNICIDLPIQSFAQLPSLTTLSLAATRVSGDVGALKPLVNLKHLDLTETQVTGDVAELQAVANLEHLHLSNTQVCGDVGKLQAVVNLELINLTSTLVCGDVDKLQVLGNLKELYLNNTRVAGDVAALRVLVKLRKLCLRRTQVTGDVSELEALVDLTVLALDGTQVTGDVSALQAVVNLEYLHLSATEVSGDVGKLQALVHLTFLGLGDTQVTGDVGALRVLSDLSILDLSYTQVCGDVGGLRVLGHLTQLWLANTQVAGDVGALQSLVKLKFLRLGKTQVTGDVGKLQALVHLTSLDLAGTQVTGNVGELQALVESRSRRSS